MFAGTVGPSLEGMGVFSGDFGAGKRILLLGFSDSRNIRYESCEDVLFLSPNLTYFSSSLLVPGNAKIIEKFCLSFNEDL